MGTSVASFSDLPQGATVVSAPAYSDLPQGATVVPNQSRGIFSHPADAVNDPKATVPINPQGAWQKLNAPIAPLRSAIEQGEARVNNQQSMAQVDQDAQHPVKAGIRNFLDSFGTGAARLISPIGIGLAALGGLGEGANAAVQGGKATGRIAQALTGVNDVSRVANGVVGAGAAGSGAVDFGLHHAQMPGEANDDYSRRVLGDAAQMVGGTAGIVAGTSPRPISNVFGQNYTPKHAADFEGLISPATGMGKNFMPQDVTPGAGSPIRQTVADMMAHGNQTQQGVANAALSPKTPPLETLGAFHNIIQNSLTNLEGQHAGALGQVSGTPVDMSPVQQFLKSQISPGMADADVNGINDLFQRAGQINNIGDLNKFRQMMNNEASPSYRQSPTQAGRASAPQSTITDMANLVRGHYFDQLQNATGQDFQPLKQQESKLLTAKEAIENQMSPLSKAEGMFNASSTGKETLGNLANILKDPKTTVTQTLLRESPATRNATLIRNFLSDLPQARNGYQTPALQRFMNAVPAPQNPLLPGDSQ